MISVSDFSRYEKSLIETWANGNGTYQETSTEVLGIGQTLRAVYGCDSIARRKIVSHLRRTPKSGEALSGYQLYDIAKLLLSIEAGLDVASEVRQLKSELNGYTDLQVRKLLFAQGLLEEPHEVVKVRRYFKSASQKIVPRLSVYKNGSNLYTNRLSLVTGYSQASQVLRQARVTGTGLTIRGDELWLGDPASDPVEEFVSGWWHLLVGHKQIPDEAAIFAGSKPKQIIDVARAVNGIFRNSHNYWHQLIEYIPAITRTVRDSGCNTVLWSTRAPENARQALNSICPGLDYISVPPDTDVNVGTLYLSSLTTSTWDSTLRPPVESCGYSAKSISSLYLSASKSPSKVLSTFRDKKFLLIRESQHRRVINEEIFVTEAEKRGFEKITLSRLSFDEQFDLFQNASVIAGFGGAEWANLVLSNSDVKILNYVSESMSGYLGHRNIGHSLGINMKTIVLRNANMEHPSFRDSIQTPVTVNHGDFEYGFSLL